jgi:hypothetical protein
MKLRLTGTEAECARLTFLLRFGPPDLDVIEVSPPSPTRGDRAQVRVDLEVQFPEGLAPAEVTFYSLIRPDGGGLLVDAWGREVDA